jgi:hypothetical protein
VLPSGGGVEALLVSPFNVKWKWYAQAGGVEESKFCIFLVVFPVRCISSASPRFYFRRHAFCLEIVGIYQLFSICLVNLPSLSLTIFLFVYWVGFYSVLNSGGFFLYERF